MTGGRLKGVVCRTTLRCSSWTSLQETLGSWRTWGSTENGKEYLGSCSSSLITLPTLRITESLSLMLPTLGKLHPPIALLGYLIPAVYYDQTYALLTLFDPRPNLEILSKYWVTSNRIHHLTILFFHTSLFQPFIFDFIVIYFLLGNSKTGIWIFRIELYSRGLRNSYGKSK